MCSSDLSQKSRPFEWVPIFTFANCSGRDRFKLEQNSEQTQSRIQTLLVREHSLENGIRVTMIYDWHAVHDMNLRLRILWFDGLDKVNNAQFI